MLNANLIPLESRLNTWKVCKDMNSIDWTEFGEILVNFQI